jgi:hypothetical protein
MTKVKIAALVVCLAAAQFRLGAQTNARAQEQHLEVLARVSYHSTYPADHSPQICFELYRNREYRLSRLNKDRLENLGGTLAADQFQRFKNLLKNLDFENSRSGFVQRGTESFVAELPREGTQSQRHIWVNPDHNRPFPPSATNIIHWLWDFDAQGASKIAVPELTPDPICPSESEKPLQPVPGKIGALPR